MPLQSFFTSLLTVVCAMAPYLLLGFLIAGILHVFVPQRFYATCLSPSRKWSVVWAALLGVPLPLCSCGVIPTAIGLRNEGASKGAVASFLIATPQTGIDSILATYSLMGLGFAIVRPVAALVTGICGGLLVNRFDIASADSGIEASRSTYSTSEGTGKAIASKVWRALKYAFHDLIRDIGGRLVVGLVVAALIQVAVPDAFFLSFGSQPLLQMLVILAVAVPMYICSTGSIPVAAALMMKGLSPGAALVMLMAGPAVNAASILVVHKAMGRRFTALYLLTVVGFTVVFGLLLNAVGFSATIPAHAVAHGAGDVLPWQSPLGLFKLACAAVLTLSIVFALVAKRHHAAAVERADTVVYRVSDMHCSHCEAAVVRAVEQVEGVKSAKASASASTLTVVGPVTEEAVRSAVEAIGYTFKGRA